MIGKVFNYISSGKTENTIIVRALIVFLSTCLISGFLFYLLSFYINNIRGFSYGFFVNFFDNIIVAFSFLFSNYLIASIVALSSILVMIIKRYMKEDNHIMVFEPQNFVINISIFLLFFYSAAQIIGLPAGTFDIKEPYYFLTYLLSSFVIFMFFFYIYLVNITDNYHDMLTVMQKNKAQYSIVVCSFFCLLFIELLADSIFMFQIYIYIILFFSLLLTMSEKPYSQRLFDARFNIVKMRKLNLNQDIYHKKGSIEHGNYTFITTINDFKSEDSNSFIFNKILQQVKKVGYDGQEFYQKIVDLDIDKDAILCITIETKTTKQITVSDTKNICFKL